MCEFDLSELTNDWISNGDLKKEELKAIQKLLNEHDDKFCTPKKEDIFKAFQLFKLKETKVLILGQDPYPDAEKAHGYAFSVLQKYTDKNGIDDSLVNIFKAINEKLLDNKKSDLTNLAKQGVLLLNTALTYRKISEVEKKNLSKKQIDTKQKAIQKEHSKIWKPFIDTIIKKILEPKNKLVIFAWGNEARDCVFRNTTLIKNKGIIKKNKETILNITDKILLLYCYHPTPINHDNNPKIDTNLLFEKLAPEQFRLCNEFLGKENAIKWEEI